MELYTTVDCKKQGPVISYSSKVMMIGSCFASNMGERMCRLKFDVMVNPYGVLYNPLSISAALLEIVADKVYSDDDLIFFDGRYHSMMHHSSFSGDDSAVVLSNINAALQQAHDCLLQADWLILTFGTSYIYSLPGGTVVANCHKMPERNFMRDLCPHEAMTREYAGMIDRLLSFNPRLRFIFTVSPIRHLRDGLHNNQVSKANLVIFVNDLLRDYPGRAYYFPAYELMLDELRDYRFYDEDMVHPSKLAVDYIWSKFVSMYMSDDARSTMDACESVARMMEHRPFDASSPAYMKFLDKLENTIVGLSDHNHSLDFSKELEYVYQSRKCRGKR